MIFEVKTIQKMIKQSNRLSREVKIVTELIWFVLEHSSLLDEQILKLS